MSINNETTWEASSHYFSVAIRDGCLLLFFVLSALFTSSVFAAWYDNDWNYRKQIDISAIMTPSTQTDFPVLISIGSDVNLSSNAQTDGDDILFTLSDGTTKLSHEIEVYTTATGELVAWVKVPSLSGSSDTTIYMYYGYGSASNQESVSNTWDSNFIAVWHLAEDPSITTDGDCGGGSVEVCDSTGNNNDADTIGTSPTVITAQIENGLDLDGTLTTGGYLAPPIGSGLNITGSQITLEGWMRTPVGGVDGDEAVINKLPVVLGDLSDYPYLLGVEGFGGSLDGTNCRISASGGDVRVNIAAVPRGVWVYLVCRYDGSNVDTFVNNSLIVSSPLTGSINIGSGIRLGARRDNRRYEGDMDELRISDIVRSDDWLTTTYNNQNSPGSYQTVSAEEAWSVSGNVYASDRSTPLVARQVTVVVNGITEMSDDTDSSGSYAIPVTITATDEVLVYIDNETENGNTITVVNGNQISGLDIYQNHLTTRFDNGVGSLSNADMQATWVSDTGDVLYSVDVGNNLTVSANITLYIPAAHNFTPGGNVTTHDVEINGTLIAGSNINLNGSWDNNAVFIAGTSTVNFIVGSGTEIIDSTAASTSDFYNISFNDAGGTATYQLDSVLNVSNDLTVTDGILDTNSASNYAINVGNDFLQPGGQVLARSSTLTVSRNFTADGSESETGYNSAVLVMNGVGLLTYNNVSAPWDNGFSGLTAGQGGNTTTLANLWLCVLDLLTVGSGTLVGSGTSSDIFLKGEPNPLSFDVGSTINIDALNFHDNLTQNIPPLVNGYDSDIYLTRTNANVVQTGVITINAGNDLILNGDNFTNRAVTYNTNGFDLNVAGNIQIGAGNETVFKTLNGTNSNIFVGGNFDIRDVGTGTQQARFISTGSSVLLNGVTDQTITSSGSSFNNLVLLTTNDAIITDALDVNGDIALAFGNLDVATNNVDMTVAGDWQHLAGSFIHGTRTVTLDGTNQFITGSTTFYNLIKSVSSADTLGFESNSTQTIASGGTLTLNGVSGQLLTLNCPGCTSGLDHWNLNISSGAFKSIDYVNVSDADADGSDVSHKPISPTNSTDGGSTISWFGGTAVITVMKLSTVISDPINGGSNPKRIPSAVIEYSVVPSNSGTASPDANTVVVTDAIDAASVAFDTTTGVVPSDGVTSSGLAMGTVTYSDTPAPGPYVYDYVPGAGYDGAVTSIRVTTTGTFNFGGSPDPSFTLRYRVRIK